MCQNYNQTWMDWHSLLPNVIDGCAASGNPAEPCTPDTLDSRGMTFLSAGESSWSSLTFPFNTSGVGAKLAAKYPVACAGPAAQNGSCVTNASSVLYVDFGDEIRLADPCNGQAGSHSNATNAYFVAWAKAKVSSAEISAGCPLLLLVPMKHLTERIHLCVRAGLRRWAGAGLPCGGLVKLRVQFLNRIAAIQPSQS